MQRLESCGQDRRMEIAFPTEDDLPLCREGVLRYFCR